MASADSKTVILAAFVGNSLIAITKFIASFVTGSSTMFSEGIHSMVDVGNQVLLLFGLNRATKKADKEHPFGYGKEVYFWSFIVAILLFAFGGGLSLYEGIKHLSHAEPMENVLVNYIVLGFAIIFEGGSWWVAFKEFKKSQGKHTWYHAIAKAKDPALIVVLLEDSAAMAGLMIALLGVTISYFFHLPIVDAITSIAIGVILLLVSVWLALESKNLLIGESATPKLVRTIRKIINEEERIEGTQNILTMHMGPNEVLVNLHVDFKDDLVSQDLEDTISELEEKIKKEIPDVTWIYIAAKSFARKKQKTSGNEG